MSDSNTPQLQLADLLLATRLIQLTAQRGAYHAEELSQVGGLYDRFVAFLKASGAITAETTEPKIETNQGDIQ